MLRELRKKGYLLAVASSKPEKFVLQILEHFHLLGYFHEVVGSEMNGNRTNKSAVVEEALKRLGLSDKRESVLMVGDKEHDVLGARAVELSVLQFLMDMELWRSFRQHSRLNSSICRGNP